MNAGKKSFDAAQTAAIDIRTNAVVSAGAGSGKTTVLVERYARLVERRGLKVDSILALTFTRKAAAEMNQRIHARLAASDDPRAREQLELFDKSRISTLDSFCGTIARGACHRFGVPPDFTVDEARLRRSADEVAVEILMERRREPVLKSLVATMGFDRVRRDFFGRLAETRIGIAREPAFAADAARQIEVLGAAIVEGRNRLEEACEAVLAIDEEGGDSLVKAQGFIQSLLPLPAPLPAGSDEEGLRELSRRSGALYSGELRRPGIAKKPGLVLLKELIEPIKVCSGELKLLVESYRLRDDMAAIGSLLDDLARRVLDRKRREGVLSFQDAAELATAILKSDPEIRAYYKSGIRSILIDEFQDNNELQKELLFLLSEKNEVFSPGIPLAQDLAPDKLFFVGDEKQSIYRFRGADVSVFRRLAAELELTVDAPTALSLNANYRSDAELVAFFNSVFPGAFGSAEREYEARFARVVTDKRLSPATDSAAVEFHIYEPKDSDDEEVADELSASASEAFAAGKRIAEGVRLGEFAFGDVAVLFRSTSRQHEYERAFRLFGIPYRAADPRGLFSEGPAHDFYALLRLCLFPSDRNAYATFLRSPFVRLGDEALAAIFLDERRAVFPEDAPAAWFPADVDRIHYERARELYRSLAADIDLKPVSSLIARLWYDEGYRTSLLDDLDARTCLDHFDKLYSLALAADRRRIPLSAFLDEIAPLMGSAEKIEGEESVGRDGNRVLLMTVHKSKGLEFPVTVVADCGNEGRGPRNDEPFYVDDEFGVVVNLRREDASRKERLGNWFFERAKELAKAKDLAETRRLLYVAATRAEKKLLFFGNRRINATFRDSLDGLEGKERIDALLRKKQIDAKGIPVDPKSFFDLIAEGLSAPEGSSARYAVFAVDAIGESDRRRILRAFIDSATAAGPSVSAAFRSFYAAAPDRPRTEARRGVTPTALESYRPPSPARAVSPRLPDLPSDPLLAEYELESAFGSLCHLLIERAFASGGPVSSPPADTLARLFPDLSAEALDLLVADARALAEGFFKSELGVSALAATNRRSEFPFLLAVPSPAEGKPYIVNGKIDLIFETQEDPPRCSLVDFKTDRTVDLQAHCVQLACYRAAAEAFSDLPCESWLFYLRGGRALPIMEEVDIVELAEKAIEVER